MIIKLVSQKKGQHIRQRVLVGKDEKHLTLAGNLILKIGEWQIFGAALLLGATKMQGVLKVLTNEEEIKKVFAAEAKRRTGRG